MTLGLGQWLRLLGVFGCKATYCRPIEPLNLAKLSARDVADLNLPQDVLSGFAARQADEDRRRSFR